MITKDEVPRNFGCVVLPIFEEPPDALDDIAQIARDAILLAANRERAILAAGVRIRPMSAALDELIAKLEATHAKF